MKQLLKYISFLQNKLSNVNKLKDCLIFIKKVWPEKLPPPYPDPSVTFKKLDLQKLLGAEKLFLLMIWVTSSGR